MKTRNIVGVSIAALFVIGLVGISAYANGLSWLGVDDGSAISKNSQTQRLVIDATDTIPRNAGEGILAGFGWFYADGPDTVFAVTTHNPVRDSHQNPDHWHLHNVIAAGSSDTSIADACIASLSGYIQGGISVQGDKMIINPSRNALSGSLGAGPAAFEIVNNPGACPDETVLANGEDSGLNLGVHFVP